MIKLEVRCQGCSTWFRQRHEDQKWCSKACKHATKHPNDKTANKTEDRSP